MYTIFKLAVCVCLIAVCYKILIGSISTKEDTHQHCESVDFISTKASSLIKKHAELYGSARIIKVTDHVYVAVGFALANMIMIEGKTVREPRFIFNTMQCFLLNSSRLQN